jgi:uncharacterized membrane protein YbhN (UPF0104 family)
VTKNGGTASAAVVSVVLEPLLMMAAALVLALLGVPPDYWGVTCLGLGLILVAIHPIALNYLIELASKLKTKLKTKLKSPSNPDLDEPKDLGGVNNFGEANLQPQLITNYPAILLLAEMGFLQLRWGGFCLVLAGITPISVEDLPLILSTFSLAWVAGLVIPVPAGLGVFESTVLVLLHSRFSGAVLLTTVGLFRLISILAELLAAGLGWGSDRLTLPPAKT